MKLIFSARQRAFAVLSFLLLPALLINSCGTTQDKGSTPSPTATAEASPASTEGEQPPATENKAIKFKQDGGDERFSLKYKSDGAKLEDASGAELARLNIDDAKKVKIKAPDDKVLGYVVPTTAAWKLENAEQSQELYVLRQQDDGDYKLETGDDKPVYRIKKREYGFEIETPDKKSLYKIKEKKGKISLRDAADKTVLYTKDSTALIAIACFGFDVLSQEQQAALAYAISQ